jgi:hypothetical protein
MLPFIIALPNHIYKDTSNNTNKKVDVNIHINLSPIVASHIYGNSTYTDFFHP